MKYLSIVIMSLMLSGCFYQTVPGDIINKSIELCKDQGGVQSITSYAVGPHTIKCKNGMYRDFHMGLTK